MCQARQQKTGQVMSTKNSPELAVLVPAPPCRSCPAAEPRSSIPTPRSAPPIRRWSAPTDSRAPGTPSDVRSGPSGPISALRIPPWA